MGSLANLLVIYINKKRLIGLYHRPLEPLIKNGYKSVLRTNLDKAVEKRQLNSNCSAILIHKARLLLLMYNNYFQCYFSEISCIFAYIGLFKNKK